MISRQEYSYKLIEEKEEINTLTWSMAGGGVRILTDFTTQSGVDQLMERFIADCQKEERTILPLAIEAQDYFDRNVEKREVLKGLDVEFIKENWSK